MINQETGEILNDYGRDELFNLSMDVVRIEIDPSKLKLFNWLQFKEMSGISKESVERLEALANEWKDSPLEWYACFEPIYEKDIIGVEVWDGKKWKELFRR